MKLNSAQLREVLADSRYSDIGPLPSQFHPYSWKNLYIRPFDISCLKLVSKAAALKDMSHMIRAIDLVITQDAGELSIGDFYYVMLWLRIHSYPKSPLTVEWTCSADMYMHRETQEIIFNDKNFKKPENIHEYEIKKCDTENLEQIHMTTISTVDLPEEGIELPEGFDFPRARDIQKLNEYLDNPEYRHLLSGAQWIKAPTVEEKFKILEESGSIEMFETGLALNSVLDHGVKETTTLHCRQCRKESHYIVNTGPFSFFP